MSKKIAHLGTVTLDTKLATSKQLNADEILANGEDVADMFSREQTYREMTTRVKLEPEDNYILYGNDGKVVSANLSGVQNGTRLFSNQTKLTEIPLSWKLDSITDGTSMCESCTNLTSFLHPLNNLSNGSEMFNGCNLNEKSVENILLSLPEYTDGTHSLTLNMSADAFEKFNEITGNYLLEPGTISYKGWNVSTNAIILPKGYKKIEYLEGSGTQYINTDIKLSNESRVICEFSNVSNWDGMMFGARQGLGAHAFCATMSSYWASFGNTYLQLGSGIYEGKLDANGEKWTMLDIVHTFEKESFETPVPSLLFAMQTPDAIDYRYLRGRISSFSISRAGIPQLNLVPCIDSLGNPCMFDTVTKETFRNEGSGQFIVPAETTTYSLRQPRATYAQLTKHGICRLYHVPEGYEGSEEDYAQEFGFKQLIENERPEEIEEGYFWHPRWKETETEVILYWTKEKKEEEMTNV